MNNNPSSGSFRNIGFTAHEKKSIASLSIVIGLRMLGLSMLIPVFSLYAIGLPGSSAFLAGVAFGIYGLTQAFFQIPFGHLSDRFGRRPIVVFGLILFGVGSVICALTDNIYILIVGRSIQGGGAIASACFAWIADLTHESRRNMAMAFMGIAVGGSIVMGMIVGPLLGGTMGVNFLFWLAVFFSMAALILTMSVMESPAPNGGHTDFAANPGQLVKLAMEPDLMRLNFTGLMVNMAMIGAFFAVPIRLAEGFSMGELWKIYIPLSFMGAGAMMLSSKKADSGGARVVIVIALCTLSTAFLILFFGGSMPMTLVGFAIFFAGFSVLEATLPAAVSKLANPENKGAIIGVYNLFQFFGTFLGGVAAGWLTSQSESAIYFILTIATIISAGLMAGTKRLEQSSG